MHASRTRPLLAAGLQLALLAALAATSAAASASFASAAASASTSAAAYASSAAAAASATNATSPFASASASTFTSINSAAARTLMQRSGGRGSVVPPRAYHELGVKGTDGAVDPRRPRPRTRRPPPEAGAYTRPPISST